MTKTNFVGMERGSSAGIILGGAGIILGDVFRAAKALGRVTGVVLVNDCSWN
jgi:hypothetical protein